MNNILAIEIGSHSEARMHLLERLIHANPNNYYHIIDKYDIKKNLSYTNINFINVEEIFSGDYSEVDWTIIPPIDTNLLKQMADQEVEFYYMIDRYKAPNNTFATKQKEFKKKRQYQINRFYKGELTFYEKQTLYYNHLRYWSWYLRANKIKLVLYLDNAPHFGYDYIIYQLAKVLDIKVILDAYTAIVDYKIFISDYSTNFGPIKTEINNISDHTKFSDSNIEKEYLRLIQTDQTQKKMPAYMYAPPRKFPTSKQTLIKRTIEYLSFDGLDYLFRLRRNRKFESSLSKFYNANTHIPVYTEKYIYIPLHFQPEMTSSPLGYRFANQLLQIQYLSYYSPNNYYLYIKEHPKQELIYKGFDFYNELLKIPKVKLIDRSISNYELTKNCVAISSLVGTAGWEGLFFNKPFIMFGNHFYKVASGVFYVKTPFDCEKAMKDIISNNYCINQGQLKKVLLWMQDHAIFYDASNDLHSFGNALTNKINYELGYVSKD